MFRLIKKRSVFSILLLNTLLSTAILAFVLIFALQRIADEHPRRYLAKVLFNQLVSSQTPQQLAQLTVADHQLLVITTHDQLQPNYHAWLPLLESAQQDPDGIAVTVIDGYYAAAAFYHDYFVVIPQFGERLSILARNLIGLVILTILAVLVMNIVVIRYLMRPFKTLEKTVRHVEQGDLSSRVPLAQTFGEYHLLGSSFNSMLEEVKHMHEVRRHMLLAIPHELKTPLTRLKVRKDLITDEALRMAVLRDITNIERILEAILHTEKMQAAQQSLSVSQLAIKPFVQVLIDEFTPGFGVITLLFQGNQESFLINAELLAILLRNLLSNALFYGQDKPVTVMVDCGQNHPQQLVISVIDRGVGIDKAQLPYITEPFWRVDPSRQRQSGGYGLGLYICKIIMDSLGGSFVIDSETGKGTRVTVTFNQPQR